ncbi:hypothetical protein [Streptomyces katrae]|uniref:hypothetical protein n=1 Tax=Streptomyces katrae TaxID=68223 RepID=UPI0012FE9999|nr:hypothetical protein [Streptomyces katrae]
MDDPDPGTRCRARERVAGWNWLATLDEGEAARAELGELLARAARLLGADELRLNHSPWSRPLRG